MPTLTPKYELLTESRALWDGVAYRIRALRDIPEHKIRRGDIGGFVQTEENLDHEGAAWIADDAMAVAQSRVEGDALMRNNSNLAHHALLHEGAVLAGHAYATDRVTIGGTVRFTGGARIEGTVLVAGDISTSQPVYLKGDGRYVRQQDLPWSLHHADPRDEGWIERLHEAVEIDPAFHRAFAALGVEEPDARRSAVDTLWSGPVAGREALISIARAVGGTFHATAYEPRSAVDLAQEAGIDIMVQAKAAGLTGFRYLRSLDPDAATDLPDGGRLFAAIVQVEMRDHGDGKPRTYFQPALHNETDLDRPTLTPLAGRTFVSSEVYGNTLDARMRALDLLALTTDPGTRLRPDASSSASQRSLGLVDHLPFVARATARENHDDWGAPRTVQISVQRIEASSSPISRQFGLREPKGYLVLEVGKVENAGLDLAETLLNADLPLHGSVLDARRNIEPIYTGQADLLGRLRHEIGRGRAEDALSGHDQAPVLVQVLDGIPAAALPSAPETNHALILAALRPLDWKNVVKDYGPADVTSYHDDVLRADALNLQFTIEAADEDGDEWSLYVERPGTTIQDRHRSYAKPVHQADALPSMDAAMLAADDYRASLMAAELDGSLDGGRLDGTMRSPGIFVAEGPWHRFGDAGVKVRGVAISRDRNGLSGYQARYDISEASLGYASDDEHRWQVGEAAFTTEQEAISAGRTAGIAKETALGHELPPKPVKAATSGPVELPAVFRSGPATGGQTSYRAGSVSLRHGLLSVTTDPDPFPNARAASHAAIERLVRQRQVPGPVVTMPQPSSSLVTSI